VIKERRISWTRCLEKYVGNVQKVLAVKHLGRLADTGVDRKILLDWLHDRKNAARINGNVCKFGCEMSELLRSTPHNVSRQSWFLHISTQLPKKFLVFRNLLIRNHVTKRAAGWYYPQLVHIFMYNFYKVYCNINFPSGFVFRWDFLIELFPMNSFSRASSPSHPYWGNHITSIGTT
jgi:hypothetical protein